MIGGVDGEQSPQIGALAATADDLVRHRIQVLQRVAAQVLQLKLKSAKTPDAANGGRFERHHDRSRNAKELGRDPCHDVAGCMALTLTFVDGPQRRKDQAVVRGTSAGKSKAAEPEGTRKIRISPHNLLR